MSGQLPDWLVSLVLDLGRAGLAAEAVRVGEALSQVDPDHEAFFAADVAVALAEAGLADKARDRIEANLTRWPDDFWVRVHAGDALAGLGDISGAEAHFRVALDMAEEADDFEAGADAAHRLRQLSRRQTPDEHDRRKDQRRQPRRKLSKSQRKHGLQRKHKP